jgi:hypothetical protein
MAYCAICQSGICPRHVEFAKKEERKVALIGHDNVIMKEEEVAREAKGKSLVPSIGGGIMGGNRELVS